MKAEQKKVGREFIKEAFRNVYQREWEQKGKSLQEFVDAVAALDPGSGLTKEQVCRWKNGRVAPSPKSLTVVCQVLGIDIQKVFYPSTIEDKYRYSSEYQDAISEWKDGIAKNCFGLNLSFLYGLKQLIDFDSEFPVFSPLQCVAAEPVNGFPFGLKYERAELVAASKGENGKGLFQIEAGGNVVSLSPVDMKYLKAIQNYIVRKVREQFAHHRQELVDCMNEATEQCKDYLRPGEWIELGQDPLSPESLQKVDKWGIYTEEEKQKYRIPDPPDELPLTAAHIEKGSEIHLGGKGGGLPPDELREFFESKRRKKGGGAGEAVPDGAEQSGGGQVPDSKGQGAAMTESGGRQKQKGGSNNGKARKR